MDSWFAYYLVLNKDTHFITVSFHPSKWFTVFEIMTIFLMRKLKDILMLTILYHYNLALFLSYIYWSSWNLLIIGIFESGFNNPNWRWRGKKLNEVLEIIVSLNVRDKPKFQIFHFIYEWKFCFMVLLPFES